MSTPEPDPQTRETSLSLLELAQQHDAAAWERLAEVYQPILAEYCRRIGIRAQDMADVVQDVLLVLHQRLPDYDRQRSFRGWLWTITRSKAIDHWRRHQKAGVAAGSESAWELLDAVVADETGITHSLLTADLKTQLVRRAVQLIRPYFEASTWQSFWLTVVEGRAIDEVASQLGLQRSALYNHRSRVLKRLKLELGDLLD